MANIEQVGVLREIVSLHIREKRKKKENSYLDGPTSVEDGHRHVMLRWGRG